MSTTIAEVLLIDSIEKHPNADRLEVAKVRGAKVVVQSGSLQPGDKVVYFPPDLLLPESVAVNLGVHKYLKHARRPGDRLKTQCRVAACRLRGVPSYGFVVPASEVFGPGVDIEVGEDATDYFGAIKYEPPRKITPASVRDDHPAFHRYTDIENYYRYPDAIPEGTPVRITEKIHGMNARVGLVKVDGEFQFMAGSHNVNRKRPPENGHCLFWEILEDDQVLHMLSAICDEKHDVIVFGEIYGPGIQDMDYGVPAGGYKGFTVFDISVDGQYLNWDLVEAHCTLWGVSHVPLLYKGAFWHNILEKITHGPTTAGNPRCKFKGREGVVVTPLDEQQSDVLGGRMILKSVSADYLDRKGAQDN